MGLYGRVHSPPFPAAFGAKDSGIFCALDFGTVSSTRVKSEV